MAIGSLGTLCIQRVRTVQAGGAVRWFGQDYQHPMLMPFIGQTVMAHETGTGAVEFTACWYERTHDARWCRKFGRKRQHRWMLGEWICQVPLKVLQEAAQQKEQDA